MENQSLGKKSGKPFRRGFLGQIFDYFYVLKSFYSNVYLNDCVKPLLVVCSRACPGHQFWSARTSATTIRISRPPVRQASTPTSPLTPTPQIYELARHTIQSVSSSASHRRTYPVTCMQPPLLHRQCTNSHVSSGLNLKLPTTTVSGFWNGRQEVSLLIFSQHTFFVCINC